MMTKTIQAIYTTNLRVRRDEKVLVFTDTISPREIVPEHDFCRRERLRDVALLTAEIGKSFAKKVVYLEYPSTGNHGVEPPEELWRRAFGERLVDKLIRGGLLPALLQKESSEEETAAAEALIGRHRKDAANVVIALSNYSTSHTRFRDFLTRICGCRYASMPLFDVSMFEGVMNVNWRKLEKLTKAVAAVVNKAVLVDISTPNGTRLTLSKEKRKALSDTGILSASGAFGNLPAGEVFLAPLEGTANGKLVLEWSPTKKLAAPIKLSVKDGTAREIIGDGPFASYLKSKLAEREENRNIAEFGIGTNERARRPDNILESEKILGTIHVALGDNSSFGGKVKTPFHLDFVFFKPTVRLSTKNGETITLIEKGALLV